MEHKFNTKFKVEEIVYTLSNKKITEVKIEKIETNITITKSAFEDSRFVVRTKYSLVSNDYLHTYLGYCDEEHLYKTKEELIKNLY